MSVISGGRVEKSRERLGRLGPKRRLVRCPLEKELRDESLRGFISEFAVDQLGECGVGKTHSCLDRHERAVTIGKLSDSS